MRAARRFLELVRHMLFPTREDERILSTLPEDALTALCAPRTVPLTYPAATVLLPFHDARVRAAIHEAKYRGSERAFALLAAALSQHLANLCEETSVIRLVPVPLGRMRHRERGFNQTEEVMRRAAEALGLTLETTLLERVRETESQVSLPRAKRLENMRGAFGAAHPANPAHLYIVIDDVATTGATLQAAIDALRAAGAERVLPIALAH